MIDTLRLVVNWRCNLRCHYCCNEIPEQREQFREIAFDDIKFGLYANVCITGGEPLLFPELVEKVAAKASKVWEGRDKGKIVLYTNGMLLLSKPQLLKIVHHAGVNAMNVGLHYERTFDKLINNISKLEPLEIGRRFQLNEQYERLGLEDIYQGVQFRYWRMNDCNRDNEDRFYLSSDGVAA